MSDFDPARHARGTAGRFAVMAHEEPDLVLGSSARGADLVGAGNLKARNPAWTTQAVKKFLGDPDKEVRNPVVRSQGKMRMFLISRAEAVEQTEDWQEWVSAYTRRAASRAPAQHREFIGHSRTGTYPVTRGAVPGTPHTLAP